MDQTEFEAEYNYWVLRLGVENAARCAELARFVLSEEAQRDTEDKGS